MCVCVVCICGECTVCVYVCGCGGCWVDQCGNVEVWVIAIVAVCVVGCGCVFSVVGVYHSACIGGSV
jgi:hypothetical protein